MKIDRRVRRTRKLLTTALLELLADKTYDRITVIDITQKADLNRATFYAHYTSKEELLNASLDQLMDELASRLTPMFMESDLLASAAIPMAAFQHVGEYQHLYRVLLGEHSSGHMMRRMLCQFAELSARKLRAMTHGISDARVSMTAWHISGSFLGLVTWWLDENDMSTTAEDMAESMRQLVLRGVGDLTHPAADSTS